MTADALMADRNVRETPAGDSSAGKEDATASLLRRVERLTLVARRNVAGLAPGDYQTAIRGQGLLFHEARHYQPGEPARRIDWNISARLDEPYVRVDLEERQRDVMIALDVSPSMHVGFQHLTKLELAVELAATLAASAVAAGDRLGHVIFADQVLDRSGPRSGRGQLFRVLRSLLAHTAPWQRRVRVSDPRAAIHAVERRRRGRFVVFLISDFLDHDVEADLRFLRPRHEVSLLRVVDPLEVATSAAAVPVVLRARDPEGYRVASVRPGETGDPVGAAVAAAARRQGIALTSFSTADPIGPGLNRLFFDKRRRTRR